MRDISYLFERHAGYRIPIGEDFDNVSEEILMESRRDNRRPKDGEVWLCYMPYFNFREGYKSGFKERRALFIDDKDRGLTAIHIGSTENKTEEQINGRYNYVITKPKGHGFTKDVFLVGSDARLLKYVTLIAYKGRLAEEDDSECRAKFELFKSERDTALDVLIEWLKYVVIKSIPDGEDSIMQSHEDVLKNERANSIDICSLVHSVCDNYSIFHRIIAVDFFGKGNEKFTFFWCLAKVDEQFQAFRFLPGDPSNGLIWYYKGDDMESIIRMENGWWLRHLREKGHSIRKFESYILDNDDKIYWDMLVEKKGKQSELLNHIRSKRNGTGNPVLPNEISHESVTSQILPGDVVPGYLTRIFVKDLGDGSYCFDDTQVGVRMRTLNDIENGFTTDNLEANFASYQPISIDVVNENIVEEAHQYIDKKLTYADVKKNMEFIYANDGIANGVYLIDGQQYRVRVETIVKREVNGTSCVFFEKKKEISHYGSMYKLPGGSVEPDKSLAEQAECEVNEEILAKVKNVNYTGKYYIVKYDPKTIPEWHKRILWPIGLKYVGAITFVFTADYDGPYKKNVEKVDQDSLAQKGDWYPIWEFEELRIEPHQGIALESMEVIEEASIYTQKYKDFDEFCEYIQTPEEVATWYSKNHVIWPPGETGSDHPFRWPNDIIKHKIGNCYDHALFMHYFCNRKGIPNKQVSSYVILVHHDDKTGKTEQSYCGHIITLFEKDGRWYEFDPQPYRQKNGNVIEGPFDSVDQYVEDMNELLQLCGRQQNVGYETKSGYYIYSEDEQKIWDKFYNAPVKDRDKFSEKYFPEADAVFKEYKEGKIKPVEQKKYFEHLRVRTAILGVIIRYGIWRVKDKALSFFTESTDIDSFIKHMDSMEIVEESNDRVIGNKIIPVDLSKYNSPGTRVLCFNPHATITALKGVGRTILTAYKSHEYGENYNFLSNMAWEGFDLYMSYGKSVAAMDIVSVNREQVLTTDLDGFPVLSCDDGTVVEVQDGIGKASIVNRLRDTVGPQGNTVIIAHDNKTVTLYAHLANNSITVKKGDEVHRGQVIGRIGNTGDCTIPHLHFETSGTTWKNYGWGIDHVGFAPFKCTKIGGIVDAFKKSSFETAYDSKMEMNDTGKFDTAFFITEDSRHVKESAEVVEESFFSNGKKNVMPVNLDNFDIRPGQRVCAVNTHIVNSTIAHIQWFKEYIERCKEKYRDSFFGTVCAIPDIVKWIFGVGIADIWNLKDQFMAVDIGTCDENGFTDFFYHCPILACNDGTVVATIDKDGSFNVSTKEFELPNNFKENIRAFGNAIILKHENGKFYSAYCHMFDGTMTVKVGQQVKRGQQIGEVGSTGNSSASHLHFEMFYTMKLFGTMPKSLTNFESHMSLEIEVEDRKLSNFYDELKMNNSGELSSFCFLSDPPSRRVMETFEAIQESAKQFKSSKAKNFKEFCDECKTPEDAMNWFIANRVVWNDKANDDKMRWPDTLVRERKGNCLDQSVMMHFFFKKRHIEHRMALFTIRLENGTTAGHIFPLFKRGKYIYAWLYIGPGHGVITGPYKSWYDAAGQVTEFYKVLILSSPKKGFDAPVSDSTEWSVQEYSETEHLDKYLNKDIIQKDYLFADGGDNLWSTHFFSRDFRFIRIPKITGVLYKLLAWSKQYQTPKEKKVAKEALELIESGEIMYPMEPVQEFKLIRDEKFYDEKVYLTDAEKDEAFREIKQVLEKDKNFVKYINYGYGKLVVTKPKHSVFRNNFVADIGVEPISARQKIGSVTGRRVWSAKEFYYSIDTHFMRHLHGKTKKYEYELELDRVIEEYDKQSQKRDPESISHPYHVGAVLHVRAYRISDNLRFYNKMLYENAEYANESVGESSNLANPVQEDYKISVYTKKYKTFDDFCKQFKTFEDLVTWFQANHIKWPKYKERNNYGPVQWLGEVHWPEDILREKVGNCFDQAIFAYYFFKRNNIPARIYRFARFFNVENGSSVTMQCVSHFVTMVRRKSGVYIFSYGGIFNDTSGPFLTYEQAADKYTKRFRDFFYMVMLGNRQFYGMNLVSKKNDERRLIIRNGYFTDTDLEFIDKLYGDKRLTQIEIIKKSEGCMFSEDGKVLAYTPFERFVNTIRKKSVEIGSNLSRFIASKESVETPEVIKDENVDSTPMMGICDHVLQYLGDSIDIQKFADIKSGRRFMYTRCKIMKKDIPLVLLLSYCEGLTTVLRKAEVKFQFSDTRPRLREMEAVNKGVIPFSDGYLVYDKFPLEVSLLMNGFGMVDTRGFEYAEMDTKDVYVSLFDVLFGTRMLANALDNFYDWMIDPVSFQILEDLNYPTDFVGLLLAGNKLLADNSYISELDMRNYRIRSNEMAYAYAFKAISEAYGKYRMTSGNKNPTKISIPQGTIIKDIMQSQVVEDVSELSPIVEVEKSRLLTDKGPSGIIMLYM